MLKSYLAIALRQLVNHKLYSVINVVGLAIGLASCLLISVFLRYELSFEEQFTDADRIYRISRDYFARDGVRARVPASNNAPVAPALLEEFSEIEQVARVFGGRALLSRDTTSFYEDRFRWADGSFFDIFSVEWLAGNLATALDSPGSIVLTRSLAAKYFGTEDPVGQTLTVDNTIPMNVTGVIRDLPDNTHLSIDAVGSLGTLGATFGPMLLENWNGMTDFHSYFRLREGASIETIESGIPQLMNRRIAENASTWSGMTVMNIRDIHLRSARDEEWKPHGNVATVYSFTAVALLILLIACINFTNLSTARSATRAREVGVRKSLGATRARLVCQFLGESVLTAALAMLVAAVIVELLLPAFGAFVGSPLRLDYFGGGGVALPLAGLTVLVGIVAGAYPAFCLSAFEPAKVIKGDAAPGSAAAAFRNVLVVAQFAIAIVLVVATTIVYQQTSFARNLDPGFKKEQIVVLSATAREGLGTQWPALKEELLRGPGALSVTASHYTPFSWDDNQISVRPQGTTSSSRIQFMKVDYDFFETYEIDVLAGRSFLPEIADALVLPAAGNARLPGGFIVNESAAKLLGWSPDEAAGATIEIGLDESFGNRAEALVAGVVGDTYFESVHTAVRPLAFLLDPERQFPGPMLDTVSIRVAGDDLRATLEHIDATWRAFHPDRPVTRHFLDTDHEALYLREQRLGEMFTYFSLLAIFLACLGLFGLASYTTERRTKEIGVRKVMGGTTWDIVKLFTGSVSRLVLVANLVAWPIAYFAMQRWLASFAYRIDIEPLVFVGSALAALALACLTVAAVAAKAASAKPIEALRYE